MLNDGEEEMGLGAQAGNGMFVGVFFGWMGWLGTG